MWKLLIVAVALASALALSVSGCAKQEFRKEEFTASASAVGFRYLPAKVDIVIVPDNSASMNYEFSIVQGQLNSFVSSLQGKYWDYHVGKVAIVNPTDINRVLVNPQYNSLTLQDGTPNPDPTGIVPGDRAVTDPSQFQILDTVYSTGAGDSTYTNLISKLTNAKNDTYTNFFRQDALLAIIVVTNGYEGSVDPNPYDGVVDFPNLLDSYHTQLVNLKGSDRLIRFYPVASLAYHPSGCYGSGGNVYQGISYFDMMTRFFPSGIPTTSLDFCSYSALSNVMSNVEQNLEVVRQAYVYSNIVLDEEPIPSSIQVYKNGSLLNQAATDGWQYKGFGTAYTITAIRNDNGTETALVPGLNKRSGYVIQLNGSARMVGTDTPNLVYQKK